MDVAHAILPLCGVAVGGSVVLAGDPLRLPPIHQAEAPAGLENLVGSVYSFFRQMHQVHESPLGINYRSNETIVAFARQSGYLGTLTSHSPNLRVDLLSPFRQRGQPTGQPHCTGRRTGAASSIRTNRRPVTSTTTAGVVSETSSRPRRSRPCSSCSTGGWQTSC